MDLSEPVAIFWDYENIAPQSNKSCYETVHKVRDIALRFGTVKSMKAYMRLSDLSSEKGNNLRSDLQSSGVSLTDCPHNGRKEVADKMMLVDMMQFGWDNPAPATIILISADSDFAYGVSVLRLRHYRVVIMAPSVIIHDSLKYQASEFYDWDAVVSGKYSHAGRSMDFCHRPSSSQLLPSTRRSHSRLPSSQETSFPAVQLPAPLSSSTSGDSRHATPNTRSRDSPISSHIAQGMDTTTPVRAMYHSHHSQESSTSEQYIMVHTTKGKESWPTSMRSSISPSTFVTAQTPSDTMTSGYTKDHKSGMPQSLAAVFTEEPGETDFAGAIRSRISRMEGPADTPNAERAMPQRATSSLPTPGNPRPTDSPVVRPATAGPILYPSGFTSSSDGSQESEDLSMSVQTLPAASTHTRVTIVSTIAPQAPRAVPRNFLPLVQVLDRLRESGNHRPLRSSVAIALPRAHPKVYENAGVQRFKQYADIAKQKGFVELGGSEGDAWIALMPEWHGLGLVA